MRRLNLPPDTDLEDVRRKLAFDLYYVERGGPWPDFRIMLSTGLFLAGVPFATSSGVLGLRPAGVGSSPISPVSVIDPEGSDMELDWAGVESASPGLASWPNVDRQLGGGASSLGFALFLLVNAMLFIRPAEFHPALYGLPIYEVCILACLIVSYPKVAAEASRTSLSEGPRAPARGDAVRDHPLHLANIEPGLAWGRRE